MEPKLNPENFNEIVFENRNRQYGAYVIRKNYYDSVNKAFFIALSGFILAIGVPLAIQLMSSEAEQPNLKDEHTLGGGIKVIEIKWDQPKGEPPKGPENKTNAGPPVVKDKTEKDPDPNPNPNPGGGTGTGKPDTTGTPGGGGTGIPLVPKDTIKEPDLPKYATDIMPEFPGGERALLKYFADNMRYPREAVELGIQGTVVLTFVIGKDGKVSAVTPLKKLPAGCTEEAMRVAKAMPDWQPGRTKDGKPVMIQYNLPVAFRLKG